MNVHELVPDPQNRRQHNERNRAMTVDALRAVGAARSIVIDETNTVLAGNGVTAAAAAAGIERVRVIDADGDELIAVRRSNLTPDQKRALALFDNRAAELATWDADGLAADIRDGVDLGPYFNADELRDLFGAPTVQAGRTDPDALPPKRPTAIQRGDLFALGNHRLLCGDCTDAADVAQLLDQDHATLMVTDPPYGVSRPGVTNDELTGSDLRSFLVDAFTVANGVLVPGAAWYVFHQSKDVRAAFEAVDVLGGLRESLIWVKPRFVFGLLDYHPRHEMIAYGWTAGAAHTFYGERTQSTIWDATPYADDIDKSQHPTVKPVALYTLPIQNHLLTDGLLFDPFCGSGTVFIACEQTARRCVALEIDPSYCQLTLDRWSAFTGKEPQQIN